MPYSPLSAGPTRAQGRAVVERKGTNKEKPGEIIARLLFFRYGTHRRCRGSTVVLGICCVILKENRIVVLYCRGPTVALRTERLLLQAATGLGDVEIVDLVQQCFVTDFQDFTGLAPVPTRFVEDVGDGLFFNFVYGPFLDGFQ